MTAHRAVQLIGSLLGLSTLIFWITNIWVNVIEYWRAGGGSLPAYYLYYAVVPVLYLLIFVISCTGLLRGLVFLVIGVFMHIAVAAWIIVDVTHPSFVTNRTTGVAILFSALWILLYLSHQKLEREKN